MKWNEESVKRGDGGGRRRRSEEGSSPGECVNHAGDAYQHCDGGCGSQTTLGTAVCVCVETPVSADTEPVKGVFYCRLCRCPLCFGISDSDVSDS